MTYAFRLRFRISSSDIIEIGASRFELPSKHGPLVLSTGKLDVSIREAKDLIIRGEEYASENDAKAASEQCRDVLIRALARLRIGADFGDRSPKGGFTHAGLAMLENWMGGRVLNDVHGLMTFETEPPPKFVKLGEANLAPVTQQGEFEKAFTAAADSDFALTEQERLAFDIFSASFFQPSQDARLLLLVVALEILIMPSDRSPEVLEHVKHLEELTKGATQLSQDERNSILGSLQWLRRESIGQAGRRLVRERLGNREYMDMAADKFFTHCYALRSALMHGVHPLPTRDEISRAAANLEILVADILSGPLIEIDL